MWSIEDTEFMSRAIKLARRGLYTTRPNPCVGCVITLDDQILGEGFHIQAGGPHAEVHALAMATKRASQAALKGATAYVTLEPCSHYGRTPPCAEALIKHGISRVVVAVEDPNPQVSGRGIKMLRDAGIEVDVGLLSDEAAGINPGFMKRMERGLPWVTVKLASSLDGKTALSNGASKWITGPESRRDVQRLRARNEALVTGIETVLLDDPCLNVRHSELGLLSEQVDADSLHQPLRVVLDSRARLTSTAKLFTVTSPILLVSCIDYPQAEKDTWPQHVSGLILASDNDGRVELTALFAHLGKTYNSVLIEAGATLAGSVISQNHADELILYQAMKILGSNGRNLISLPDYTDMADIPSVELIDERKLGGDTRLTLKIRS
ncbi:bifunctional diaminohydroxyphosphoribosylaminopyrimidine deaminase/5-amino-6-(5-phosphoribosylamino)uracil reductase RibD [Shewanella violacea]|uniref:Riboflavin biosynthesis protein RibD n=1 Tax=Shewanella violacea (strain JCM 10179 / CIP 106290 / LMG 19151 / DSS12) TaxID=637905 RepID=D4ZAX4_SHEVD|nr:bifunctional diaminohydroxyphosphoribosylaminopyrimidine deaminase/5-amino-6-(5-phosphoribosylamino)uracil reductase RibD [Shewanella violacea]BAJ03169.1 riboflavin biosynthesis protein RibD [Shewanella violacea DSS12]